MKYFQCPYLPCQCSLVFSKTNPDDSDAIMKTVRRTLAGSAFSFEDETRQAAILSGETEGTSGWITANYLAGNLGVVNVAQ